MNKIFPQIIYRFAKFTGFEEEHEYKTFSDGKVLIGGVNPREFTDEDSKIKGEASFQDWFYTNFPIIENTMFPFTNKNSELRIWEKFANDGAGISIGISTNKETLDKIKELFNLDLEKVTYSGDIPTLPKQYTSKQIAMKATTEIQEWIRSVLTTKLSEYEYESEYRFFGRLKNYTEIGAARIIALPPNIIREVILGYAMEEGVEKKTLEFCGKYLPKAEVKRAVLDGEKIRIVSCDNYK